MLPVAAESRNSGEGVVPSQELLKENTPATGKLKQNEYITPPDRAETAKPVTGRQRNSRLFGLEDGHWSSGVYSGFGQALDRMTMGQRDGSSLCLIPPTNSQLHSGGGGSVTDGTGRPAEEMGQRLPEAETRPAALMLMGLGSLPHVLQLVNPSSEQHSEPISLDQGKFDKRERSETSDSLRPQRRRRLDSEGRSSMVDEEPDTSQNMQTDYSQSTLQTEHLLERQRHQGPDHQQHQPHGHQHDTSHQQPQPNTKQEQLNPKQAPSHKQLSESENKQATESPQPQLELPSAQTEQLQQHEHKEQQRNPLTQHSQPQSLPSLQQEQTYENNEPQPVLPLSHQTPPSKKVEHSPSLQQDATLPDELKGDPAAVQMELQVPRTSEEGSRDALSAVGTLIPNSPSQSSALSQIPPQSPNPDGAGGLACNSPHPGGVSSLTLGQFAPNYSPSTSPTPFNSISPSSVSIHSNVLSTASSSFSPQANNFLGSSASTPSMFYHNTSALGGNLGLSVKPATSPQLPDALADALRGFCPNSPTSEQDRRNAYRGAPWVDIFQRCLDVLKRDNLRQKAMALDIGLSGSTLSPMLRNKYKHTKNVHVDVLRSWAWHKDRFFLARAAQHALSLGLDIEGVAEKVGIPVSTLERYLTFALPIPERAIVDTALSKWLQVYKADRGGRRDSRGTSPVSFCPSPHSPLMQGHMSPMHMGGGSSEELMRSASNSPRPDQPSIYGGDSDSGVGAMSSLRNVPQASQPIPRAVSPDETHAAFNPLMLMFSRSPPILPMLNAPPRMSSSKNTPSWPLHMPFVPLNLATATNPSSSTHSSQSELSALSSVSSSTGMDTTSTIPGLPFPQNQQFNVFLNQWQQNPKLRSPVQLGSGMLGHLGPSAHENDLQATPHTPSTGSIGVTANAGVSVSTPSLSDSRSTSRSSTSDSHASSSSSTSPALPSVSHSR
eukprot:g5961.t1